MGHAPLPADRDGKVEDGEHVGPLALDVEVGDDSGSDGGVAGLAHTHQAAGQEEEPEVLGEGGEGEEGRQTTSPSPSPSPRRTDGVLPPWE